MYGQAGYFPGSVAEAAPDIRATYIRKVYGYFFLTVLTAILAGAAISSSEQGLQMAFSLRWPIWIGGLILAWVLGVAQKQTGTNTVLLFVFAAATGIMVTPAVYMANQVAPGVGLQAAILTGGVFGGLSWYAWFSRKDFSFLGGFLFAGLIGLILTGLLFIFFPQMGNTINIIYCLVGVLIFSGYVLYDTSRILYRYPPNLVIPAVVALYLDILNLFMFILRLLTSSQRRS